MLENLNSFIQRERERYIGVVQYLAVSINFPNMENILTNNVSTLV